ncbi:Urb2/Npa2 family-domain-containing protein [Dactylonectria estremocensis]|uniref:Urb2/Npa2 family-domain-containing protein n=1 Tax=Dactylonectria estremocensis TaxID=1079267 RepID=A0A9P9JI66_9HYPO|nr:Urb2/Npa2 family-domain-containing protein [Dactylonectria estremocensis]
MDVTMTDASSEETLQHEDKTGLIKTVRGLDQSGPGANGETLEKLWKQLTASADGQFHATEESSLRWLLKSMNGSSKDAETMRRWPLTWTILECVFQRIPLFSLAKSLADRRFIVVLQQTLKDISQPSVDSHSTTPTKRKRSTAKSYVLEELKDSEGCLMVGDAVFHSLKRLLGRLDSTATQSSHDKIGAEHIRSLFCTTAADAAALVSLALSLCDVALTGDSSDYTEGRETWVNTISSIWDLHLQGVNDTLEVATYLFGPSAVIISKLERISKPQDFAIRETLRTKWSKDIQNLMYRNLIRPARASFITRQDFEVVTRVLEVTETKIDVSAPALYFLTSGVTDYLGEGRLRKGNGDWMKRVFKAVEASIRERNDRDSLMQTILERAAQQTMPVDNDDLRIVCREYALHKHSTNWRLLADISTCDPDVFQLSEDGASLLEEVCERSTATNIPEGETDAVSKVIGAIVQGFRTGRDFPNFLKLWFKQLCKVEKQKSKTTSPWLLVGANQYGNDDFNALIEKEMSAHQLLEVLTWTQNETTHSRALCLFLNSIAQGIRTETYSDAVGKRLFDLVNEVSKSSSNLTALKWGVVSKTLSWVGPDDRVEIWKTVKKQLANILIDAPIDSRETFEAFKCCCQAWISLSPDDQYIDEPIKLVDAFTNRLALELITSKAVEGRDISSHLRPDAEPGYLEEAALEHYVAWFLRGSSRLNRLLHSSKGVVPKALENVLDVPSGHIGQLKEVWGSLLGNENNLNDSKVIGDLIDRLTKSLEADGKEKRWPAEGSQAWIQGLSGTPTDAFTRPQREAIMALLHKHRANTKKRVSVESWKMILGLSTKLMGRPTFYEEMRFADNVEVADAMSDLSSSTSTDDGTLSDLIEAFFAMASATIRQMAEHIEDRSLKYFEESREFISDCDNAGDLSPFRLILLKALVVETTKSPNFRSHAALTSLPEGAKEMLSRCVMTATGYFMTEKKAYDGHNVIADLRFLAAVNAAEALDSLANVSTLKQSDARKAEKRSQLAMVAGDLRGWKMQTFLRTYFSPLMEEARPTTFHNLDGLPPKFRESLLTSNVASVTRNMETAAKVLYLKDLVAAFVEGSDTNGQASAIQTVVNQLIESPDLEGKGDTFGLANVYGELTAALLSVKTPFVSTRICRILHTILEKKPQFMTQWNVEFTLSTVCDLSSFEKAKQVSMPYVWLCKLVEAIIKKHRLRLEGHHHLLLTTMQTLLRNLVFNQGVSDVKDQPIQESKAHLYARLVTLICEPTAGAVSRSQHQSALDSATDAAKRSAGRDMYLVLMQYVKLQLEADVPRLVREVLEPAMNSVFDITPPEVRKILNDGMDGSGRAILREMYKRYTKFGKWSGV